MNKIIEVDLRNGKKRNYSSISIVFDDIQKNECLERETKKYRPSREEKQNMIENREKGIKFFEEGNSLDDLTKEELEKISYFFKQGYEIAKRRDLARKLTNKRG